MLTISNKILNSEEKTFCHHYKIPCVAGFLLATLVSNLPTLVGRVFLLFLPVIILRIALLVSSFSTFFKGRRETFLLTGDFFVGEGDFGTLLTALFLTVSSGFFLAPATPKLSPKSMSKVSQPGFLTTFWTWNCSFLSQYL